MFGHGKVANTLAVCDTEPIAIEGLRVLMECNGGPRVIAMDNTIHNAVNAVRQLNPAVVIVDRGFGVQTVMDWLRLLRAEQPSTAAIVWGTPISESDAIRFVQAGASGVIRKTAAIGDLLTCIRTVFSGGTWMEFHVLHELDSVMRGGRSPLTARELQVMELVERGMKNKEIATALGIQTGTVKIHLKHIFEKTGVRGRYGLALSGLKQKGVGVLAAEPS
jgi:DNA-binding NarL/FixJ family response regulator